MKKTFVKKAAACGLCLSLLTAGMTAGAVDTGKSAGQPRTALTQITGNRAGFSAERTDGRMVIREAGEYTLTGNMRGMVYVDPGAGDVKLTLDGARLNGGRGAAIAAVSGDSLTIEMANQSSVIGGAGGDFGAAIYSAVPLRFAGTGRLDMRSQGQDAILVKDHDLNFDSGELRIVAGTNGLDAGNVNFNGGSVAISAGQNALVPGAGVNMNGGTFSQGWTPGADFLQGQNGRVIFAEDRDSDAPAMPGCNQQSGQQPVMPGTQQSGQQSAMPGSSQQSGQQPVMPGIQQNGQQPVMPGTQQSGAAQSSAASATAIATGTTENSAMSLEADYNSATTYDVSETSDVKITESGTYIVTGTSEDGSITVKKGTTGVVLVLDNLDLTSTSSATLSINKEAEVQVIVSGNVTLTDNENPADEYSEDADVADAYDGAAIKVKADSVVFLTGDGTLNVNGTAKNGIKGGDNSSIILGGEDLAVNITAANDGINGNYDVTILSGTVNVSAGDDGIHADRILTIGDEGAGPDLTVSKSTEGLEGTVVNIAGGTVNVTASDDAINAANADGVYEGELDYAVNITGGAVNISTMADGLDSNGDINLVDGSLTIQRSASGGGDAGIDYDGSYYVSDSFRINNANGVAGPDNMMGGPGMGGQTGGIGGQTGGIGGQMGGFGGQTGGMGGQSGFGNSSGSFGGNNGGFGGNEGGNGGFGGGPMGR